MYPTSQRGDRALLITVLVISGLLSVVAIVVSSISLYRENQPDVYQWGNQGLRGPVRRLVTPGGPVSIGGTTPSPDTRQQMRSIIRDQVAQVRPGLPTPPPGGRSGFFTRPTPSATGSSSSSSSSGYTDTGDRSTGGAQVQDDKTTCNNRLQGVCSLSPCKPDKIWMIAVGHDWGAMEYTDEAGYLRGFQIELINEVCSAANMECRTVWEPYENCWDSEPGQHSFGGKGLLGDWYDACAGWVQTKGRLQVFEFSMPFLQNSPAKFYRRPNDTRFDARDLTAIKGIGFLDGWWTDEKCLARILNIKGTPLPAYRVRYFSSINLLQKAVLDGQVDAGFLPEEAAEPTDLETLPGSFVCSTSGPSMMTRRDNSFNAAWNRGFQTLQSNGRYQALCEEARETHAVGRSMLPCL